MAFNYFNNDQLVRYWMQLNQEISSMAINGITLGELDPIRLITIEVMGELQRRGIWR
jgi:hypothetical protein